MIPLATITTRWHQINARFDKDFIRATLKELHRRQPLLMCYLLDAGKEDLDEQEQQMLYSLGWFIVKVMLDEHPGLPEVTEGLWKKVWDINLEMFKYLAKEETAAGHFDSLDGVIRANRQAPLLRFVFDALMNDPLCLQKVRRENVCILFLHLKIALDCLNKAGEGGRRGHAL